MIESPRKMFTSTREIIAREERQNAFIPQTCAVFEDKDSNEVCFFASHHTLILTCPTTCHRSQRNKRSDMKMMDARFMTCIQLAMPAGSIKKESKICFLTAKQYNIAEFFRSSYIFLYWMKRAKWEVSCSLYCSKSLHIAHHRLVFPTNFF